MPGLDLHVHSTHSDGTFTPAELVARARELGLDAISITDHDSVDGIADAVAAGIGSGVDVVPGVELSAERDGVGLHILGYLMDHTDAALLARLRALRDVRASRAVRIVEVLRQAGLTLSLDDVLAASGGGAVGRAHVARVLIAMSHARDMGDAFDRFLGEGAPYFVPKPLPDPAEVISWIVTAGGVAVLAHPGLSGADDMITHLHVDGLRGIEAYHPAHDSAATARYLRLADQYHLVVTGGSDFHGSTRQGAGIGSVTAPTDALSDLRRAMSRETDER